MRLAGSSSAKVASAPITERMYPSSPTRTGESPVRVMPVALAARLPCGPGGQRWDHANAGCGLNRRRTLIARAPRSSAAVVPIGAPRRPITAVVVIVPARDEAASIAACLRSIERAAAHCPGVSTRIVVAADRCRDGTAAAARATSTVGLAVIEGRWRGASAARAAAARHALGAGDIDPGATWLAHTDADCTVPPRWLARQLTYAAGGVDAIAGDVVLDATASPRLQVEFAAAYERRRRRSPSRPRRQPRGASRRLPGGGRVAGSDGGRRGPRPVAAPGPSRFPTRPPGGRHGRHVTAPPRQGGRWVRLVAGPPGGSDRVCCGRRRSAVRVSSSS